MYYKRVELSSWQNIQERYKNYIPHQVDGQELLIFKDDAETEWLEQNIGLNKKVKLAVLGALGPFNVLREHIDGHYPAPANQSNWSLNIPISNCDKSQMFWFDGEYEIVINEEDTTIQDPKLVADNAQYLRPKWTGEKILKDSTYIDLPTAVRITVPHQVINHSNNTRVMLAIRFTPDIF